MTRAMDSDTPGLATDKQALIVDVTRRSIAERGVHGATFEHVAREARISRGLLHYYFGSKERLLIEVIRRDCEFRMALVEDRLSEAGSASELVSLLVDSARTWGTEDPEFITLLFEMFTFSRRNAEIAAEFSELMHRTQAQMAEILAEKQAAGLLRLAAAPATIAYVLYSLADGMALRALGNPSHDAADALRVAEKIMRQLISDP